MIYTYYVYTLYFRDPKSEKMRIHVLDIELQVMRARTRYGEGGIVGESTMRLSDFS